jgi:hypothetical protein
VFRLRLTDTVNNRRDHIRICQGPVAKRPGELTAERHGNNRRDKIRVYQALVAENRFSSEGHGDNRREKRSGYNREAMSRRRPLSLERERETHGQNSQDRWDTIRVYQACYAWEGTKITGKIISGVYIRPCPEHWLSLEGYGDNRRDNIRV